MSTVKKVIAKKGNDILSVSRDCAVFSAIKKMAGRSLGTALVMDGDQLVGIFSERDFIRKVYLQDKSGKETVVGDVMSAELMTVHPEETVENCMKMMTEKRIRHLPVLDNGRVVGIISIGDIVKFIAEDAEIQIKNLESYISGPGL